MMKRLVLNMILACAFLPVSAFAKGNATKPAKPAVAKKAPAKPAQKASAGGGGAVTGGGPQEALEVRGQTRALSMMLVLRSKKDKVDFVRMRTDYKPEIGKTEY